MRVVVLVLAIARAGVASAEGTRCARAAAALATAQDAFHDDDLERAALRLADAASTGCADAALTVRLALWRAGLAFARGDRSTARAGIAEIDPDAVAGLDEFWPSFVAFVAEVRIAMAATPRVPGPVAPEAASASSRATTTASTCGTSRPAPRRCTSAPDAPPALDASTRAQPRQRSRPAWLGGGLVLRSTHDRTISNTAHTTRVSRTGSGGELVAGAALGPTVFGELHATALGFRDAEVDAVPLGVGAGFIASTDARLGWRWRFPSAVGGTVYAVASGVADRGGGMLAPRTVLAAGIGASIELRWRSLAVHAAMQWAPAAWAIEHAAPGDTVDVSAGALAVGVRWAARPDLELSAGFTNHTAFETTHHAGMRNELDDRRLDLGVAAALRR